MANTINITDTDVMLDGVDIVAGTRSAIYRTQSSDPVSIQVVSGDGTGIQSCVVDVYCGNDETALKRVATITSTGTELFSSNVAFQFWQVEFVSGFAGVNHRVVIAQ